MPAAPHYRAAGTRSLDCARHRERVMDWRAGQHRDADTQSIRRGVDNCTNWIALEPAVDDDDVDLGSIERGRDCHQCQRHREENSPGVIKDDALFHDGSPTRLSTRRRVME